VELQLEKTNDTSYPANTLIREQLFQILWSHSWKKKTLPIRPEGLQIESRSTSSGQQQEDLWVYGKIKLESRPMSSGQRQQDL
jgi:hypothetical protein